MILLHLDVNVIRSYSDPTEVYFDPSPLHYNSKVNLLILHFYVSNIRDEDEVRLNERTLRSILIRQRSNTIFVFIVLVVAIGVLLVLMMSIGAVRLLISSLAGVRVRVRVGTEWIEIFQGTIFVEIHRFRFRRCCHR